MMKLMGMWLDGKSVLVDSSHFLAICFFSFPLEVMVWVRTRHTKLPLIAILLNPSHQYNYIVKHENQILLKHRMMETNDRKMARITKTQN